MSLLALTTRRVNEHTAAERNAKILANTRTAIEAGGAGAEAINARLSALDAEWDSERTSEANAASQALIGVLLTALVSPWWLLLPGAVTAFLLQYALQGGCPPLPVLRRLGLRTQTEIDHERCALKALRGDFLQLPTAAACGDATSSAQRRSGPAPAWCGSGGLADRFEASARLQECRATRSFVARS